MVGVLAALNWFFVLCSFVAFGAVGYEYFMCFRSWRLENRSADGFLSLGYPLSFLAPARSPDSRKHRRRLLWAVVTFVGLLALQVGTLFLIYGPNPGGRPAG
jgi:hypothetical protein